METLLHILISLSIGLYSVVILVIIKHGIPDKPIKAKDIIGRNVIKDLYNHNQRLKSSNECLKVAINKAEIDMEAFRMEHGLSKSNKSTAVNIDKKEAESYKAILKNTLKELKKESNRDIDRNCEIDNHLRWANIEYQIALAEAGIEYNESIKEVHPNTCHLLFKYVNKKP